MGITRRQTLVSGLIGGVAVANASSSLQATDRGKATMANGIASIRDHLNDWLSSAPLFDRDNACAVLDRYEVDGLLVSSHTNVYHLTGVSPATDYMFPQPLETYALLCRDENQPVRLLMFDFTYYYASSDERPGKWLETRIYTGPSETSADEPRDPFMLRAVAGGTLTSDEERRRSEIGAMAAARSASARDGLIKMLADSGLRGARIATDSANAAQHCSGAGLGIQFIGANAVLGEIRRIKSPIEIALMRNAASSNAQAAVAAARTLRAGATHTELRSAYFEQAALAGGLGVFMAVDRATSQRYDRELTEGRSFLIDGVSQFFGYHGDFGRTVFIGEPDRRTARIVDQIGEAWKAVRAKMVVGSRYSDLIAAGEESLRRSNMDLFVNFKVHSVGLWHTDDPAGQTTQQLLDTELRPGMVLSVDCPLFDEGVGGSAHYEDLTLITIDGPVALNEVFDQSLVV